uniref:Uncharacterized protein n=1 Tax=Oryza punctata TaxID=4537 RepID=A0A0E0K7K2_ORYPU
MGLMDAFTSFQQSRDLENGEFHRVSETFVAAARIGEAKRESPAARAFASSLLKHAGFTVRTVNIFIEEWIKDRYRAGLLLLFMTDIMSQMSTMHIKFQNHILRVLPAK